MDKLDKKQIQQLLPHTQTRSLKMALRENLRDVDSGSAVRDIEFKMSWWKLMYLFLRRKFCFILPQSYSMPLPASSQWPLGDIMRMWPRASTIACRSIVICCCARKACSNTMDDVLLASEDQMTGDPTAWAPRGDAAYDPTLWDAGFLEQMKPGHRVSKDPRIASQERRLPNG